MKISESLNFFIQLSKSKTIVNRRFDNRLSFNGLGFNEFIILFHLSQSPQEKMRRIDLAEAVGLTASGVTRMLLPMEKIGLVKREVNKHDARVSFVVLALGGKRLFNQSIEEAEILAQDLLTKEKVQTEFIELLTKLGKTAVY